MPQLRDSIGFWISLLAATAIAQQAEPSGPPPSCIFSETYQADGWTIPGVDGAAVKRVRSPLASIPGVFITMLDPIKAETNLTTVSCPYRNPGRLEIKDQPIRIMSLWAYDMGGQIFAYRLQYALEAVQDGKRSELAASSAVFFYDMDGSGRFTVMKGAGQKLDFFQALRDTRLGKEWRRASADEVTSAVRSPLSTVSIHP